MAIDLVTRREWGAREPRGSYGRLTSTKGVKVHYTGGQVSPDIVDDHARCVAMVRSIQNFHMDGNGWMDIGYSMVACPHRKVFEGRGPGHLPAANGAGLNSAHYAVLGLVGNAGLVQPTDGILNAILDAVDYLRAKGGAGKEIKGHRDGYSTDCPGTALYAWVKEGAPRPGGGETPGEPH
ncbi:peptidoglycan recognition protein family protein, partial [Streptosporangium saharense]|uniref:peptidoglycan recognition protein family protein n=1 Tax=Streptosporangium saharense TaxID=1706840 RepID=UPI00331FA85A